jgi:dihydrofolate reductase
LQQIETIVVQGVVMSKEKRISIIAAVAENGVIGLDNTLPWRIRCDMERFKKTTMGKTVVMGRKTYDSLPNGALLGRENIVITRKKHFEAPGCIVVHSFQDALARAKKDVFVIGGAEIYEQTLSHADNLYVTIVRGKPEGDTFFPFGERAESTRERPFHLLEEDDGDYDYRCGPYCMPVDWKIVYWEEKRSTHEDEFDCIFTEWNRKK